MAVPGSGAADNKPLTYTVRTTTVAPREGVKLYSCLGANGYGLAATAYVRGLVNAGVPVHWVPVQYKAGVHGDTVVPFSSTMEPAFLAQADNNDGLRDLRALRAATARPLNHACVLAHVTPEHWGSLFEPGRRNIGYTTWEADALPPHWPPLLNQADAVCVPCTFNQQMFRNAGIRPPVHVVPHMRRHMWHESLPSTLEAVKSSLGIPAGHFVFYTIGTWDPRKNLPLLLRAFLHTFQADEPVSLIVKTNPVGYGPPRYYLQRPSAELAQVAMDAVVAELGRPPPSVCLLPYELSGNGVDQLHALGDCYVSLSHGEGWGLGAFEAASLGTPVVMTGWGGQLDFLGPQWPGAVSFDMTTVPVWPPHRPSFWPPQRWASADWGAAMRAMREAFDQPVKAKQAAAGVQSRISDQFSEPAVVQQLLRVIHG